MDTRIKLVTEDNIGCLNLPIDNLHFILLLKYSTLENHIINAQEMKSWFTKVVSPRAKIERVAQNNAVEGVQSGHMTWIVSDQKSKIQAQPQKTMTWQCQAHVKKKQISSRSSK